MPRVRWCPAAAEAGVVPGSRAASCAAAGVCRSWPPVAIP